MVYSKNGTKYNIPDDYLSKQMQLLKISKMEAVQLWLEDEGVEANEEQEALDKKGKAFKPDHGIAKKRASVARERKPNEEKREIIQWIADLLGEKEVKDVKIPKVEREVTFKIGENDYSITLICHRPNKK